MDPHNASVAIPFWGFVSFCMRFGVRRLVDGRAGRRRDSARFAEAVAKYNEQAKLEEDERLLERARAEVNAVEMDDVTTKGIGAS